MLRITRTSLNVLVVVNFLSQLIFIFPLFLGIVMYLNEFETKEKQKLTAAYSNAMELTGSLASRSSRTMLWVSLLVHLTSVS